MRVRLCINAGKPGAEAAGERLAARAAELGLSVADGGDADVVMALGGDGTFLHAVRKFPGVPVLGLNLGGLGYLASVERRDFPQALELLAAGRYRVSERAMLEVRRQGSAEPAGVALNDVVVARETSGHAIRLDLAADGRLVTRYLADGLIVATPTGSTAYSLAAGGPVLMPDSGGLVVTPANPHALGVRPMVVRDTVRFTVTARARTGGDAANAGVYADGEGVMALAPGGSVEIFRSAATAKLVELEGYDPYGVLARKLGWSGSNVE
ncbi:MAG: NAD(+)/NADH kinase [Kiritimatiellae bacterium]|nr:NAD(+)/NADH kinase [Kiritimatiellia bacterium]